MKALLRLLLISLTAIAAFFGLISWHFNRPPFHLKKLDHLVQGMSKAEVETIIGSPKEGQYSKKTWSYSRSRSWPIVYIYFDDSDRFRASEYDY